MTTVPYILTFSFTSLFLTMLVKYQQLFKTLQTHLFHIFTIVNIQSDDNILKIIIITE